jgi:hypothetical protein
LSNCFSERWVRQPTFWASTISSKDLITKIQFDLATY